MSDFFYIFQFRGFALKEENTFSLYMSLYLLNIKINLSIVFRFLCRFLGYANQNSKLIYHLMALSVSYLIKFLFTYRWNHLEKLYVTRTKTSNGENVFLLNGLYIYFFYSDCLILFTSVLMINHYLIY